jgi:hypothetical protein
VGLGNIKESALKEIVSGGGVVKIGETMDDVIKTFRVAASLPRRKENTP